MARADPNTRFCEAKVRGVRWSEWNKKVFTFFREWTEEALADIPPDTDVTEELLSFDWLSGEVIRGIVAKTLSDEIYDFSREVSGSQNVTAEGESNPQPSKNATRMIKFLCDLSS